MGSNHEDRLLALASLIEVTAIVPVNISGGLQFLRLGLEVFVDVHIGLDVDRFLSS